MINVLVAALRPPRSGHMQMLGSGGPMGVGGGLRVSWQLELNAIQRRTIQVQLPV